MPSVKVLSMTTNLTRYGGAQKVLMDIHNGLKKEYNCKIVGRQNFKDLHSKYQIGKDEYVKFKPSILKNSIVLVHARNVVPFVVILNRLLFLNAKIIYVSHNVYSTHRHLTLFPKNIVSISKKVTENLLEYFKVKNKNINLIYNGIEDSFNEGIQKKLFREGGEIKILYPARVNNVKRQLEIVKNLKGKIVENIKIYFAGTGDDLEKLKIACQNSKNFHVLGFVENMDKLMVEYDFLMLYSIQEGLPIALLEGVMNKKPLLVNDVGGNFEIGVPGFNAIGLKEDWDTLANQLNQLNTLDANHYEEMAKNSRQLFLEKFLYCTMIKKYSNLIKSIQ